MAFDDELEREGSTPSFCLELLDDTPTTILRASDLGYSDTSGNWWQDIVSSMAGLVRSINLDHLQPQVSDVSIPLLNENQELSTLAANTREFFGLAAKVFIKYTDLSDTEQSQQIGGGIVEINKSTPLEIDLTIRPTLSDRIGQIQPVINSTRYPNARDKDIGKGSNILYGIASETNGVVECPMIDEGSYIFEASIGKIKSVTAVIRKRGEQKVAVPGGFTWGFTTDGESRDITQFTLSNGAADYQDGDVFLINYQGLDDLGTGLGTVIHDPSEMVQDLLTRFSQLSASDLDTTSFNDWSTRNATDGLDTSGVSAIIIPWKAGQLISDPIDIMAEIAQSFDVAFYINGDGEIAVSDTDVVTITDDPSTLPNLSAENNLETQDITVLNKPFEFFNKATCYYGTTQSSDSDFIGSYSGEDTASVAFFQETIDAELFFRFVRDQTVSQTLASGRILRAAGKTRRVVFPLYNLEGLKFVPGDRITISHPAPGVDGTSWIQREVMVETVDLDHSRLKTTVTSVTVGDVFGPVKFSGEVTTVINVDIDTWIDSGNPTTTHGSDTQLKNGNNIGGAGGDVWRIAGRFDFLSVMAGTETIQSIALEMYSNGGNVDPPAFWAQAGIRRLNETTWGENSTWNNFLNDGAGAAWSDSLLTTDYGITLDMAQPGWHSYNLNAAAITQANADLAATGKFQLGFVLGTDTNEWFSIQSEEGTFPWRLRVVYTL
jgi:hypothetical protein